MGILPFMLLALAGIWVTLDRSRRDAQILEVLTLERFSESLSWKASVEARSAIHLECEDRVMTAPLPKEVRDRFARRIVEGVTG